jgi:hypothetical protein
LLILSSKCEELAMVLMDVLLAGDVSIDFPNESATFWYEKATGNVFP